MAQLSKPKLILDFKQVPDWLLCTRGTTGNYFYEGVLKTAAVDELRVTDNGLLIEPARTNSLLYSRDLSNAAWSNNSFAALTGTGLDGVPNSCSYIDVSTQTDFTQALSLSSDVYCVSCYLKRHSTNTGDIFISVDGSNFIPCDATGDWIRFSALTSATTTPQLTIRTSGKLYVDGCQIEAGLAPTMPIHTSTADNTRSADLVYFGMDLWPYNPTEGSWLIKSQMEQIDAEQTILFVSESTPTSDYMNFGVKIDTDRIQYIAGYGTDQEYEIVDADIDSVLGYTLGVRICSTYDALAFAYINGSICKLPLTPQTAGINYNTLDRVWIGSENGTNTMNGVVNYIAYYDFPLSQDEGLILTR